MKAFEFDGLGSHREFVGRVLIVAAIAVLGWLIWSLSDIILLVFAAILFAILLRVVAEPLVSRLHVRNKPALALAGLFIVCIIALAAFLIGPAVADQLRVLYEKLPGAAAQLAERLRFGSYADFMKEAGSASSLSNLAAQILSWSSTFLGALASLAIAIFGGIYLAMDPSTYRNGLIKLVPAHVQPHIEATMDDTYEALRRWLLGQFAAMVIVGLLTGLGLWLVGVPSALALALITGLAEFVPVIGPLVASVPTLIMASSQDTQTVLWAAGVLIVVQQIESNLVAPLVAERTVAVAPAVGLFAVVAMGVLFGPLGLLLGFPLAVVTDIAVRRLYVLDTLEKPVEILGETIETTSDDTPVEDEQPTRVANPADGTA
jgi:predicted PurR-regulated permease PerM